jgi:hypothetical protein
MFRWWSDLGATFSTFDAPISAGRVAELQMGDPKRSFVETLDYRIAESRFESAFEACERLPQDDQQLLLRQIAERIIQHMAIVPSDERTTIPTVE